MKKITLLLLLLPLLCFPEVRLSDRTRVSVLTCGLGHELYSLFGHTAIRIKDPQLGLDVVYNYGAFDFSTPNFGLRFVKGDMQYFVAVDSFNGFMQQYQYEQRSVVEQELFLPLEMKQQLFDELSKVLASDENFYTYKFIDRNCTNMAMHVINKVLGEPILKKTGDTSITYREIIYPYFDGHFFEQWGTSVIFGKKVDEDSNTLFLPTELEASLASAQYQGKPLSEKSRPIIQAQETTPPFSIFNSIYLYLAILLGVALANKKVITATYFVVIGGIGAFFCVAGAYSLHEEVAWNYNVLLFNPLLIVIAFGLVAKKQNLLRILSWISAGLLFIYALFMLTKIHLAIVTPMIALHGLIFWRILKPKSLAAIE